MKAARLVLLAGAALYFAGALFFLGQGTTRDASAFAPGSSLNETKTGVSLAKQYLGTRSRILALRLEPGAVEPGALVLRVRPSCDRKTLLSPGERAWLASGGRLVLAVDSPCGPLVVVKTGGGAPPVKVFPVWPGLTRFEPLTGRVLGSGLPAGTRALVTRGPEALLARWRHGRGEVIFLAAPEMIENGGLGRADHLRLLEAWAAGHPAIYFDEHAHGLRQSIDVLDLLTDWGFGPSMIAAALLAGAAFWRQRMRVGPPDPDRRDAPAEAVDLLDSLAHLYDRALAPADALGLYRQHLARAVAHETGLRGDALAARVAEMTGGRAAEAPVFSRALSALNEGYRRLKHAQAR